MGTEVWGSPSTRAPGTGWAQKSYAYAGFLAWLCVHANPTGSQRSLVDLGHVLQPACGCRTYGERSRDISGCRWCVAQIARNSPDCSLVVRVERAISVPADVAPLQGCGETTR